MKYFIKNKVLVDSQNNFVKELSCPAQKHWQDLLTSESDTPVPKRYCDGCNKPVYDISELTEPEVTGFINDHEAPCVHIDFRRSAIVAVNDFADEDNFIREFANEPRLIQMHKEMLESQTQHTLCSTNTPDKLIRTTESIDVMKHYLAQGYGLQLVSVAPLSEEYGMRWIRYDKETDTITLIENQDEHRDTADIPYPAKAYLIPPNVKPGDKVLLRQYIHPFHSVHFVSRSSNETAKDLLPPDWQTEPDLDDNLFGQAVPTETSISVTPDWDEVQAPPMNTFSPPDTVGSLKRTSITPDIPAYWDGTQIKLCDTEAPVAFGLKCLNQMRWALQQGYRLQIEALQSATEPSQWLRYEPEQGKFSLINDSDKRLESDTPMPAGAYAIPAFVKNGDHLYVENVLQRHEKEIYAMAYHQGCSYVEHCEGVIRNGQLELLIQEPVMILG